MTKLCVMSALQHRRLAACVCVYVFALLALFAHRFIDCEECEWRVRRVTAGTRLSTLVGSRRAAAVVGVRLLLRKRGKEKKKKSVGCMKMKKKTKEQRDSWISLRFPCLLVLLSLLSLWYEISSSLSVPRSRSPASLAACGRDRLSPSLTE